MDFRFLKGYTAIFKDYNFIIDGRYTSKNYTENFFGFGNETINPKDQFSLDYNRVNLEIFEGGIGIERETDYGSYFQIKFDLETTGIERNGSNFLETTNTAQFGKRFYFGVPNITYAYKNTDNMDSPAKGMDFSINVGAIDNFNSSDLTGFAKSHLVFYNSLTTNGRLVFKTGVMGHVTVGDELPFFQSPHLGGHYGLRGYRNQRFTGENSFAAAADVIYNFEKLKTFFFPMDISIFGGMRFRTCLD